MTVRNLAFPMTIREKGDVAEVMATTPTVDYTQDRLFPLGMRTDRYMGGPRALNFAHNHGNLPVGRVIELVRSASGIAARFKWLKNDPQAAVVRNAFEQDVLGASIEFMSDVARPNEFGGLDYLESTLTGLALTGNPANPECVRLTKALDAAPAARHTDDDEVILILDDEPVRRDAIDTWPQAVVHARQDLTDFLASLGEEAQQAKYDVIRQWIAAMTAWLESLTGGRSLQSSEVAALRREVRELRQQVCAVGAQRQPREDEVIVLLDDEPPDDLLVDMYELPGLIGTALRDVLAPILARETRRAINEAAGRINDDC